GRGGGGGGFVNLFACAYKTGPHPKLPCGPSGWDIGKLPNTMLHRVSRAFGGNVSRKLKFKNFAKIRFALFKKPALWYSK
ncbi:MAG: hypothetical protein RR288_03170, partial [Oscillibacter sp.]